MEQYPTIHFVLRFGDAFAIFVALLTAAVGIVAAMYGLHRMALAAGALASLVPGVLMKSDVEIARVSADMLIPR
jgi:hypothetical protein